ncbi:hypothetical protein NOX69_004849, partial [Pseudomonas aeruginosa]|nr:hypothetical protein [Pseudomonas aeruginosa]
LVRDVIIEDWPENEPLPRVAVADLATKYMAIEDVFQLPVGNTVVEASGFSLSPVRYQPEHNLLSASVLLKVLQERDVTDLVSDVRYMAAKYEFALHPGNTPDAVRDSAQKLGIVLDEACLAETVQQLLHSS